MREVEFTGYQQPDVLTINASFNNTVLTLADAQGKVLYQTSCGKVGFKGSKRSSSFASQVAGEAVGVWFKENRSRPRSDFEKGSHGKGKGFKSTTTESVPGVDVRWKGIGQGREGALRGLRVTGVKVLKVSDCTPLPHNGTRPKKVRRV